MSPIENIIRYWALFSQSLYPSCYWYIFSILRSHRNHSMYKNCLYDKCPRSPIANINRYWVLFSKSLYPSCYWYIFGILWSHRNHSMYKNCLYDKHPMSPIATIIRYWVLFFHLHPQWTMESLWMQGNRLTVPPLS